MHRIAVALAGASLLAAPLAAQEATTEPIPTSRVAALCEAWTAARYLHPHLAYRDVDWDGAFADAAATAWGAPASEDGRDAYRAAAEAMLAALDDPATELVAEDEEPAAEAEEEDGEGAAAAEPPPLFRWIEEPVEGNPDEERARGVLLIDVAGYVREAGAYGMYGVLYREAARELAKARAVIVDLRHDGALEYQEWVNEQLDAHLGGHVARESPGATERWLVHWGYRADDGGGGSGGYRSAFASSLATVYTPADPEAPARPFVFLVDESTDLPDSALALRGAGNGYLVSTGPPPEGLGARRMPIDLGEGMTALVRVMEKAPPAGVGLEPDAVVEPSSPESDPAMGAARALVESTPEGVSAGTGESDPAPLLRWRPAEAYPEMTAPGLGYRLLAACRAWGVIRHFYPYLHLLDDWDGAFRASLPEFAAAEGEEAYARAILRLMAHVEDGHTNVWSHAGVDAVRGTAPVSIALREIEGRMVVTRIGFQEIEGVEIGDVLLAIDGLPIEEGIERLWPVTTGSRELTHRLAAARWSLFGEPDTTATLTLRGADGTEREAMVLRTRQGTPIERPEREPWRLLDPAEHDTGGLSIGYVDLTELQVPQVEPMIAALRSADAIVFDLRGYPNGTAWPLAPYLNVNGATEWASFRRREVSYETFGSETPSGFFFIQAIPQRDVEPYRGKTVMLIDERAISQSEHTAMMFQEAAGTVMVGTPTAGANGDVTHFVLPGGVHVLFTGHDVRHADDSQLQRVGIVPDVEAAPTVEGLRAGRDEVLEVALGHLRETLGTASDP
jgi:C-terminal processing protease CtpA/Prc